ncbi:hypothetical protein T4B_1766 [Trichinella pseudospiralis]|uniref:Uncharacterized protein n=1 Tax=Trichinella pseudospiralis TaxID=6337 RepID=A0A0V1G806_TRIPS|nr:hypothetical protein T4B_1766 [Trichinella pseudospiralis]
MFCSKDCLNIINESCQIYILHSALKVREFQNRQKDISYS